MTAPRSYILTLEVRLKDGSLASFPAKLTPKRIMLWHPEARDTKPRAPGPRGYERERHTRVGYSLGTADRPDIPYHLRTDDLGPATSPEIREALAEVERREAEARRVEREAFDRSGRIETSGKALLAAAARGDDDATVLRLAAEHRAAVRDAVAHRAGGASPEQVTEILDRAYRRS